MIMTASTVSRAPPRSDAANPFVMVHRWAVASARGGDPSQLIDPDDTLSGPVPHVHRPRSVGIPVGRERHTVPAPRRRGDHHAPWKLRALLRSQVGGGDVVLP